MLVKSGLATAVCLASLRLVSAAAASTATLSPELPLPEDTTEPPIPDLEVRNGKHHGHHITEFRGIAAPTDLWVAVGLEGTPTKTFTPKVTTVDGKTSIKDAPPYEITGTVFTEYHPDRTVFATRMPQPTLEGEGSYPVCNKQKGERGYPFCWPHENLPLYVGATYYVTWNPDAFNDTKLIFQNKTRLANGTLYTGNSTLVNNTLTIGNTTLLNTTTHLTNHTAHRIVRLIGHRVNQTDGEDDPLFETDDIPGTRGMYMLNIPRKFLHYKYPTNLSLTLVSSMEGGNGSIHHAPILHMMVRPKHENSYHKPREAELYIALPIIFGFMILMTVGLLIYHRKTRHIGLGSIMGKSSRSKRLARNRHRTKKQHTEAAMDGDDIPLMEGHEYTGTGSDTESGVGAGAGSGSGGSESAKAKKRREPRREMPNPFNDYPSYLKVTQGAVVRNPNTFYEDLARKREEERRMLFAEEDDYLPGELRGKKME